MKKKHCFKKFKPIQELYDHGFIHTLFDSKDAGLSKVSSEELTDHQASVEELSQERKVKTHNQLPSSEASSIPCTSCVTSYSEEFQSVEYLKGPSPSEDSPMLHNELVNVNECQGDDNSCISKEDDTVMISSDHCGGADHKIVISNAPLVGNCCPDVLEKSLNGQTIRIRSLADQPSFDDGDKNSMEADEYSGEATLPSVCCSDVTEYPFKDECDGLDHKVSGKPFIFANTETGSSDKYPSATVLNNFDGSVKYPSSDNLPITSTHIMHESGSEELVDVRVCDICGDVGREALLALCSKCSDGAEHTYCMSPKMDKVPESDWLCEECMLLRDPKTPRQAMMEGSDNALALKPSSLKEQSQGLPEKSSVVQHVNKLMKNHLSEASLSDKRLLKRTVARNVQPLKVGSGMETRVTRVPSLKNMDKGKDAARQVSSFVDLPAKKVVKQTCSSGDRSPKLEQQFCGGSSKVGNSAKKSDSDIEVRRSRNIYQRRSSAKENDYSELKKGCSGKEVPKSMPQTGGGSISINVSNAHSSPSTLKSVRYKSGRNINEARSPVVKKTIQLDTAVADSSPVKLISSKTKVASKVLKVADASKRKFKNNKAIQVNGNTHSNALGSPANEVKNCIPLVAESVEESKSPCNSSYAFSSPAENVNAYCDQRVNTGNTEVDDLAKDKDEMAKDMTFMPKLDPEDTDHKVPSAISAVPESRCIWKGTFNLERSRELPVDGYGVQAHLSTSASPKVIELALKFSPEIQLKKVPRLHTWPIQFQKNHPTEQDIALYFFAQDLWSYGRSYKLLLESMTDNDLALEANFSDFQLLVFPSILLPVRSQRWNSLPYLWGVFRKRKVDGCALPSPSDMATVSLDLNSPATCGSESKLVSVPVTGSCTFHNSIEEPESVGPVVLQSSALVKSADQNFDHGFPFLEKHIGILQNHVVRADSVTFDHAWRNENSGGSLRSNEVQKRKNLSGEDTDSISKTDIVQGDQSAREYTEAIGFCSDEICKGPSVQVYDSGFELWQRLDVASWSSFSVDSGPSGSSDGGWATKSADEPHVEPVRSSPDLDLNLCIGSNRSGSEAAAVDLDLALGLPTNYDYQPKSSSMDESYLVVDSSVLSLGMPCSTR